MKLKILALDFGTKTGWAHSNGSSGTFDLSIRKDESSGMRLIRFESKLLEVLNGVGIDVIAFEAVTAASGPKINLDGVKLQTKLQAVIERLVVTTKGLECCSFNLSAIKKHAIPEKGKKRDKEAMLAAAREQWPDKDIVDDNEADACFLLSLCEEELQNA